jgi:hypothetical protein
VGVVLAAQCGKQLCMRTPVPLQVLSVSVKKSQLQPGGKMLVRWSLGVSEDPASLVASMTAPPPTPGIQTLTLARETLP